MFSLLGFLRQPNLPPPHERHLARHDRREQHVGAQRQAGHLQHGVCDMGDLHAIFRAVGCRLPGARRSPSRRSCPWWHCRCRSARSRCRKGGRRARASWSGPSPRAWCWCRPPNPGAGRRRIWKLSNSPRWNGCPGSTTSACSLLSAISRRQMPRQTTIGHLRTRSPRRPEFNQTASTNPGAIHSRRPSMHTNNNLPGRWPRETRPAEWSDARGR